MADSATIRARRGGGPDWRIEHVASIDSTNRALVDAARSGAPEGTTVVADHQTAGRGRLGRSWHAAPGSALLVSVLLRPAGTPDGLSLLTMAAGLALAEAVEAVAGVRAGVKWPNDLVVGDRKLAGILAEADISGTSVGAVVVGVGCNLTAASIPPELRAVATACEVEAGRAVGSDELLVAFLDALGGRLGDLAGVPSAYRARSATLGRRVRLDVGSGAVVVGDAVTVSDTGALVVRDDDGSMHTVAVGDVVHLRAVTTPDPSV
jgi:BirA family biotin operon repressor/biotin-[acetyl-CoA-carboxylase] ligase